MDEQIFEHLRDALNNLYDAEHLRASPLAKRLNLAGRADTPVAMQKALEGLIQALKPRHDDPIRSQKRRMYDLLYSRYVDQFSQKEVANQLGISLRSYQREQKQALEFLAGVLVEKYPANPAADGGADPAQSAPAGPAPSGGDGAPAGADPTAPESALEDEFSWMFSAEAQRSAELEEVLASACQLAQPVAEHYRVTVRTVLEQSLPRLAIHPQALLQIVLNLLLPAIHVAAGGTVTLRAGLARAQVELTLRVIAGSVPGGPPPDPAAADQASLVVAQRLAEKAGGSFKASLAGPPFSAAARLPTLESLPVLVVDDNADNITLMQRYLAGTRYLVSSLSQPELALELVEQARPRVVLLDLMMPGVDGLEILTQLHSNPQTVGIPVVVCTILPQEELALLLGASAFLRKPVSREDLLATLDRLTAGAEPYPD